MPYYDYECQDEECAHLFEHEQDNRDEKLTECPKCGKETLIRLIAHTPFHLKGTGWHGTDY